MLKHLRQENVLKKERTAEFIIIGYQPKNIRTTEINYLRQTGGNFRNELLFMMDIQVFHALEDSTQKG